MVHVSYAGTSRTVEPLGPFDLAGENRYFGGWPAPATGPGIVMGFPVEGWRHSAAVWVRQDGDGPVRGTVHTEGDADAAWRQALAALSLDVDGRGYPAVGERDPVIGALQRQHAHLRPVLFHSPYEAACGFVIGHRLGIVRGRVIRQRLAAQHGEAFEVAGSTVHAFPSPHRLLEVDAVPGISAEKVRRLHAIARAAIDGILDRHHLRELPEADALGALRQIPGIGPFFASGILLRGAGVVDAIPSDEITLAGVRRFYRLDATPTPAQWETIAERWRPYRMWCSVLVHASERRSRDAA
jgi:DNA-3-methyladenine glycosylase II